MATSMQRKKFSFVHTKFIRRGDGEARASKLIEVVWPFFTEIYSLKDKSNLSTSLENWFEQLNQRLVEKIKDDTVVSYAIYAIVAWVDETIKKSSVKSLSVSFRNAGFPVPGTP